MECHGILLVIWGLLRFGLVFSISVSENLPNFNFSRNHFGVLFRSPAKQEDGTTPGTYSENDLIQLVDTVSTRFSKLLISPIPIEDNLGQSVEARIPIAVAHVNVRNNQSVSQSGQNNIKNPNLNMLQLYMGYEVQPPFGTTNALIPFLRTSFYTSQRIADKANRLYRNTVKYLVTFVGHLLDYNGIDAVIRHLTLIKLSSANGVFKYKIGVKVYIEHCGNASAHVESFLGKILPLVDIIIFQPTNQKEANSCGVDITLECTQIAMQKCRKKLASLQPHLEVVFASGLPRTGNSSQNGISNMVQYWNKMNAWALKSNTTVVMYEAFDEPSWTYLNVVGWWQIKKNHSSNLYNFRELYTTIPFPALKYPTNSTVWTNNSCLTPAKFNHLKQNDESMEKRIFSRTHFGVYFYPLVKDTDDVDVYDEQDVVFFIEKISIRFVNILIDPILETHLEEQWSISHIPNAVAKVNSNNKGTSNHHIIQVFMQYELQTAKQIHAKLLEKKPLPFDLTKQVADNANLVFPGTVKYLLLQAFDLSVPKIDNVLRQLDYARRQTGNFTYDLGLILDFLDCDVTGVIVTNKDKVIPLMQQVSMVFFEVTLDSQEIAAGVEAMHEKLTTLFSLCSSKLKTINPQLKVGYVTHWPDTPENGIRNVTALTWFWGKMNSWAAETNNMNIMMDAFDRPHLMTTQPTRATMGWWKFVKDRPCYNTTGEYTFIEKLWEEDQPSTNIGIDIGKDRQQALENFLLAGKYNLSFAPPQADQLYFGEQFGVYFHPYVNKGASSGLYSEEDVEALLSIVKTRFSKVLMVPVNEYSRHVRPSTLHTPKAAAQLNKIRNEKNLKTGTATENLEVFVSFYFDPLNSTDTALQSSIDLAQELADMANDIYAHTVPCIILLHENLMTDLDHWKRAETQVKYFLQRVHQKRNGKQSHSYLIGGLITAEYCDLEDNFLLAKKYLLPHLQLVLVKNLTTLQHVTSGVDAAFSDVIYNFEECKAKIVEAFPDLKVGLFSTWSDIESTWRMDPFNLVRFWRKMNDYADANKTLVFLREAFDHPDRPVKSGWWRLVAETNSSGSESEEHYVVQEKYHLFGQPEVLNGNGKSPLETFSFKLMLVTVSAGVLAVATVCVVAFIVFRKIRRNTQQRLSNGELVEFFEGVSHHRRENNGGEVQDSFFENATSLIKGYAYDTSLELPKHAFVIDESSKLGSGAFGTVCLARICKDGKEFTAAVKRVNPEVCLERSLCSLRSLLSEVKVLSFLGKHENVVELLAAHTGDIRKGEVFVFLEPCALGSLKKYLGTLLKAAKGKVEDDYLDLQEENLSKSDCDHSDQDTEVSHLLANWSLQIAQGMEFLASKHVVHADLAARNVLLNKNKMVKICDFGLSRRMYNYESYVKSNQEPLPWRWLPPESLRRWEFDEKSDVWAYGVTLWEIYTLGDVPYSGLSWDQCFFSRLEEGLRLREPVHEPPGKYKENEMYQVMLRCWENEPNSRPMFTEIASVLIDWISK